MGKFDMRCRTVRKRKKWPRKTQLLARLDRQMLLRDANAVWICLTHPNLNHARSLESSFRSTWDQVPRTTTNQNLTRVIIIFENLEFFLLRLRRTCTSSSESTRHLLCVVFVLSL